MLAKEKKTKNRIEHKMEKGNFAKKQGATSTTSRRLGGGVTS
jgi:hypothetical protein